MENGNSIRAYSRELLTWQIWHIRLCHPQSSHKTMIQDDCGKSRKQETLHTTTYVHTGPVDHKLRHPQSSHKTKIDDWRLWVKVIGNYHHAGGGGGTVFLCSSIFHVITVIIIGWWCIIMPGWLQTHQEDGIDFKMVGILQSIPLPACPTWAPAMKYSSLYPLSCKDKSWEGCGGTKQSH